MSDPASQSESSILTSKSSESKKASIINGCDLEDGPLFRATIKELESKTADFKAYLKRIIKAAVASLEAKQLLLEQDTALYNSLKQAPFSEPLFSHYLGDAWTLLREQRERLLNGMQTLLISPLEQLYDKEIKTADRKRRQFEHVSKDYYANLAKYLSPSKKFSQDNNSNVELKFMAKKRDFDLVRFDYYTFLTDLHGGKKEQEIIYHLLNHYEKQFLFYKNTVKTLEPLKHGLDDLGDMIVEASREQNVVHQERSEQRKILISKYKKEEQMKLSKICTQESPFHQPDLNKNDQQQQQQLLQQQQYQNDNNIVSKFKGIRDMEQHDITLNTGRRKEGFLFATSRPIKSTPFDMSTTVNWHKYWCVLSGGQLHEYSNWKRHLETHIEPINLRFATVREARNADRRFCFEIITPNFRRMYQATSSEELSSWIATINNAISSLLNGMCSSVNLNDTEKSRQKLHHRSLSGALTAARDKYLSKRHSKKLNGQHQQQQQKMSSLSSSSPAFCPNVPPSINIDLLNRLRQHDPSNNICADCSAKDPEWCSLNLGILICIECSGIHRSLGTHISKVRSLTLDSTSYTQDIVQLILAVGNSTSNQIWESNNVGQKPQPTDTRDIKLKYIQKKYVSKDFVQPSKMNANTLLFEAIDQDDIPKALHAIALGADVNHPKPIASTEKIDDMEEEKEKRRRDNLNITRKGEEANIRYALHFALLHGQIHWNQNSSSDSSDNSSCSQEEINRIFPMAEFLFQNGADVYIVDEATGCLLADLVGVGDVVDDDAIHYINMKNSLRGQSPIVRSIPAILV